MKKGWGGFSANFLVRFGNQAKVKKLIFCFTKIIKLVLLGLLKQVVAHRCAIFLFAKKEGASIFNKNAYLIISKKIQYGSIT